MSSANELKAGYVPRDASISGALFTLLFINFRLRVHQCNLKALSTY